MASFLEMILTESTTDQGKSLSQNDEELLVRCYPTTELDQEDQIQDLSDRIFKVAANVKYQDLQSYIDQKFQMNCKIQYIVDDNETVMVDSDLVLQRAI